MSTQTGAKAELDGIDPQRWGLPAEPVATLGRRLYGCWEDFRDCFTTRTRDTSELAHVYLQGLLLMPDERNYANIARRIVSPEDDGQALQHFLSDSPWSADRVFARIQERIRRQPTLAGGVLSLDETGDERAGECSAGSARQWLGRYGKTDVGQVGVVLSYSVEDWWTLVDAQLYLPQHWFDPAHAKLRHRLHVPPGCSFATKPALGLRMVRRAHAAGLPFVAVAADAVYGRDGAFRAALDHDGILYVADVPCDYPVYAQRPEVGVPQPVSDHGRPPTGLAVVNGVESVPASSLVADRSEWQTIVVREGERGPVEVACWARRVWTIAPSWQVREEWLVVHEQKGDKRHHSLSNAPADTPLATLMGWRSQRYFVERAIQDSKSALGWDEFQALKYRAWMHHAALNALALYFLMDVRRAWAAHHPRHADLAEQLEVNKLPALSLANLRELLRAVMPLPQLTVQQARRLVAQHLTNRARSTASRLRQRTRLQPVPASGGAVPAAP